jgi:hypothetical protein
LLNMTGVKKLRMRINGYVVITNLTKKPAVRKVGRKVDRISPS